MSREREPAVAGSFYPDDPVLLEREVRGFLTEAPQRVGAALQALIAPHAGYRYSGAVAGRAFATLRDRADNIERVVLLGPAHTVRIAGMAVPRAEAFRTPLGIVPVDHETIARLGDRPDILQSDRPHAAEHALELELPFLQVMLGEFTIVPIVVGWTDPGAVGEVLSSLWGASETLVVVSSDLSHYLSYEDAQALDQRTADAVLSLQPEEIEPHQACGAVPVRALLMVAKERGLEAELLDLRNSGDTAGDRNRVVGYGAFAFTAAAAAEADRG